MPASGRFFFRIDQDLAEQARQKACPCGGRLHSRQLPPQAARRRRRSSREYGFRLSFCCERDGCRKRVTPPSVRFLGRKVYLGAVVILVAAMRQGPSPRRVRELSRLFGADRHTIARWQVFWSEHFPQTPFWKVARGRLVPAVEIVVLPLALLEAFLRADDPCQGLEAAAAVSRADHDRRGPGDRGFSIIPPGPQKMRVDGPGGP